MLLIHCSLMIASWAAFNRNVSAKSTPSKVGGTLGLLARKRGDSGVGMLLLFEFRRMRFDDVWSVWTEAANGGNGKDRRGT